MKLTGVHLTIVTTVRLWGRLTRPPTHGRWLGPGGGRWLFVWPSHFLKMKNEKIELLFMFKIFVFKKNTTVYKIAVTKVDCLGERLTCVGKS
jgi:hypothetical protein